MEADVGFCGQPAVGYCMSMELLTCVRTKQERVQVVREKTSMAVISVILK